MANGSWSVAEAKAKFSEVVEKARVEGPQLVTKNGKEAVIVSSVADWRATRKPAKSFVELLLAVPPEDRLTDEEAETLFKRDKDLGRFPIEF